MTSQHALIALTLVLLAVADVLGFAYGSRLPDHRGLYLVPVEDRIATPVTSRPRHTAVIVVDGLRRDFAEQMPVVKRLRETGQCVTTDVGPISISRPSYAVISTGLEQDRSGARNNASQLPLFAASIWEAARAAGLRVAGASHLDYWQELFPRGFDAYSVLGLERDVFAHVPLADVNLYHPLYVDETGHDAGAASPEYAAAVRRADREIAGLLSRLDLTRDLVVLTSDHGHRDRGGHGARQPEIANVLTCYAGRGVQRRDDDARIVGSTVIAPSLAVLAGVSFPRHMRATDDDLDWIWRLVDPALFDAEYLQDRRRAVERFRFENSQQLSRWSNGRASTWNGFYRLEMAQRADRLLLGAALLTGLFTAFAWRRRGALRRAGFAVWLIGSNAASVALYVLLRGSFDFSSINKRSVFISSCLLVCIVVVALAAWLHLRLARDLRALLDDAVALGALSFAALLLHIAVYGWPLGFPLPGAALLFYPYFGAVLVTAHWLLVLGCQIALLRRASPE